MAVGAQIRVAGGSDVEQIMHGTLCYREKVSHAAMFPD